MKRYTNLRNVSDAVADREEFTGSNLQGMAGYRALFVGRLPASYHGDYDKARYAPDFYVVVSYSTPITWFADGEWFIPNVKYSASTSRQLGALGLPTRYFDENNKRVTTKYVPLAEGVKP